MYPAGGQAGSTIQAVVRGANLKGTYEVWTEGTGLKATVLAVDTEPEGKKPADLVRVEIHLDSDLAADASFRLLAPGGVSNALRFYVHQEPVQMEAAGAHELPKQAQKITHLPVAVHGRIAQVGEVDYYSFQVKAGDLWRFRTLSSEALDPALSIYKLTGSWFDPDRATRLAFSDEPVPYPDLTTEASLQYKFAEAGEYLVRVNGFWGYGGPGQEYVLLITRDDGRATPRPDEWKERTWTRPLRPDRMNVLQARALPGKTSLPIPVVDADAEPVKTPVEPQKIILPTLVVGTVEHPGDIDRVRFSVKEGEKLAFEVETPEKTLPLMNPFLRVLDGDGVEVVTNIYSVVNSNGNASKQIKPKTQYSFPRGGEFTLEIRDITASYGDAGMKYRVLLRPQVPHVGEVHVAEDRLNLIPGKTQKLSVVTDQEEGFDGYVIVSMEGLPEGVRALGGTEVEPDSPPSESVGKRERFTTKKEKATLIVVPEPGTPRTERPVTARVYAQPVVKGELGARILVKEVLIMVIKAGT